MSTIRLIDFIDTVQNYTNYRHMNHTELFVIFNIASGERGRLYRLRIFSEISAKWNKDTAEISEL